MTWMVAPSYAHATIVKVDENERKALVKETCGKCGGTGFYAPFGTCYRCEGAGYLSKWVKAYTPEEYDKYIANQERAKVRKAEKIAAEKLALENASEDNKRAFLVENGYDVENPLVWLILGDTYSIKDALKAAGCRFKPELGWYATHVVEIPEGYEMTSVPFDDIFNWKCHIKKALLKEEAKEVADAAKEACMPESSSEYIGEEKERLRNLHVVLKGSRLVESYYGTSILYTFNMGENVITWFCSGAGLDDDIEIGDTLLLTGTVKKHQVYNGVKQTVLNRCKAVKI